MVTAKKQKLSRSASRKRLQKFRVSTMDSKLFAICHEADPQTKIELIDTFVRFMDLQDVLNDELWSKDITCWREAFPKVDHYLTVQKISAVAKLKKEHAERQELMSHKTKQLELILNTLKVIDTAKCKTLEAIVNKDVAIINSNNEVSIAKSNNEVAIVNSNNNKEVAIAIVNSNNNKEVSITDSNNRKDIEVAKLHNPTVSNHQLMVELYTKCNEAEEKYRKLLLENHMKTKHGLYLHLQSIAAAKAQKGETATTPPLRIDHYFSRDIDDQVRKRKRKDD